MIKKVIVFVMLILVVGIAEAQTLTAAKKIPPKIAREGVVNATPKAIWKLLAALDKVTEYNAKLVKSVEKEGDGYEAYRLCKMVDGSERGEDVVVFAPKANRICFSSTDSQYPVDRFVVNYYIKPVGKTKSKVSLEAYFDVNKGASKTKTYKAIGKELSVTVKGIQNYFKK